MPRDEIQGLVGYFWYWWWKIRQKWLLIPLNSTRTFGRHCFSFLLRAHQFAVHFMVLRTQHQVWHTWPHACTYMWWFSVRRIVCWVAIQFFRATPISPVPSSITTYLVPEKLQNSSLLPESAHFSLMTLLVVTFFNMFGTARDTGMMFGYEMWSGVWAAFYSTLWACCLMYLFWHEMFVVSRLMRLSH